MSIKNQVPERRKMESNIKDSEKSLIGRGEKVMKEQDRTIDSVTKECQWLVDSPNLDAIDYYLDLNEETLEWHCKLLNKSFANTRDCQKCFKCVKHYNKISKEMYKKQIEESAYYLEDDELFDFERKPEDCEYFDISEEEFWGRFVRKMPNRNIKK